MIAWTASILILVLILIVAMAMTFRPYKLPKIVWTHWDTPDMPELCHLTLNRMKQILPDWDVRFFTKAEFLTWCPPAERPPGLDALSKQHQADFMRLWLLRKHGGAWIDISIVLNESIDNIYDECVRDRAELSGFYIEETTTDKRWPVFENWFIMAPAHSRIIEHWYAEYYKAIATGFLEYKRQAKESGLHFHNLLQKDDDVYLTQHLCFQKVIQHQLWFPRIRYRRAEDAMFYVHKSCDWNNDCMEKTFHTMDLQQLPYIKLRGGDRDLFPLSFFD